MDAPSIILIIVSLVNVALASLVYSNNKRSAIKRSFALFIIGVALWSFTNAATRLVSTVFSAWVWSLISYYSAVIIAGSFFYFSNVFPYSLSSLKIYHKIILWVATPIVVLVLSIPGLTIKDIILEPWQIVTGSGLFVFTAYFAVLMIWSFVSLTKKFLKVKGIRNTQIKYILTGTVISALLGATFNLVLPIFNIYSFVWLGPIFVIFMVLFTAYAITRHRFLDIRLVVKKSTVYITSLIILLIFVASVYYALDFFVADFLSQYVVFVGLVVFALGVFIFGPIHQAIQSLADKLLFKEVYDYQQAVKQLSSRLTTILKLEELVDSIIDVMIKTMRLDRAGVLLGNEVTGKFKIQKIVGFDKMNGISLVRDSFFTKYITQYRKPLVLEEIQILISEATKEKTKNSLQALENKMKKMQAALVLPLITRQKLIGLIVLGSKEGDEAYSHEDIELLTALTNQASVAIENAKLYNNMEDMVKNRTREIAKKNRALEAMNKELIQMNKMKSEFLTIASHQLRTPLSAAWGFLSMLKDGTLDDESLKEKHRVYNMIYEAISRLNAIVNDLLDAMELDNRRIKITKRALDLNRIIRLVVKELSAQAEGRNVEMKLKLDKKLPRIKLDRKYITEVVMNLVDNAIKYTPAKKQGTVTIITKQEDGQAIISIKDQGIGIPKLEQKKLFDKFQRASNARLVHTDGSGLGLYIVRQVVESHKGQVLIDSPGKDKGTTVTVYLPLK